MIINVNFAQKIAICLFYTNSINTIVITPTFGSYTVSSDNQIISKLLKNEILYISEYQDSINIRGIKKNYGNFKNILIYQNEEEGSFRIKPIYPSLDARNYLGNLQIKSLKNKLQIVNRINIEDYISGVVETEGGAKAKLEYYKSQAIICRTYLIGHLRRHEEENFHLCDGVHCQAYKSKCSHNLEIVSSTNSTKNLIIVDENNLPITASFHSNCGGETVNSENVWTYPKKYLKSIIDTFCTDHNHSIWADSVQINNWINYLVENNFKIRTDINLKKLNFEQNQRKLFYVLNEDTISLKKIRADFGFKSTFFNIRTEGEKVYFDGKGYGHGVGLCQEGAMKMAVLGKNYSEIIEKYYRNISIREIDETIDGL